MKLTNTTARVLSAIIKEAEQNFPNVIPINTSPSLEEFRRLQGHQEVIQFFRNMLDEQNDEDDDKE